MASLCRLFALIFATAILVYLLLRQYIDDYIDYDIWAGGEMVTTDPSQPFMLPVPFDCGGFIAGNQSAIANYRKNRHKMRDPGTIDTNCSAIHSRFYYPKFATSTEEILAPVLIVRTVYQDYLYNELLLSASYSPNHFYCYVLDSKASGHFKQSIRNLAGCFSSNVFVLAQEFRVDSFGRQGISANLACLKWMLQFGAWKYALLLQQHDFIVKTPRELSAIAQLLNGSSHMRMISGQLWHHRVNWNLTWHIAHLKLLNESQCSKFENFHKHGCNATLQFAKGDAQVFVSRAMVEFVLNDISTDIMVKQMDASSYNDELFWQSLNYDIRLKAPGGFPHHCLLPNRSYDGLVRYSVWQAPAIPRGPCRSGRYRHWLCMLGLEDLREVMQKNAIMVNKFLPSFDVGPAFCLYEQMYNRRYIAPVKKPSLFSYENLVEVRYNKWLKEGGNKSEQPFKC